MNVRRALRGLLAPALLSALVYALLAAVSDWRSVSDALRSFPGTTLLLMLSLTLANYVIRSFRLRFLVRLCGHDMAIGDALFTQFGSITMTVTPGKVGEVLKALLVREYAGLPVSRGVAIVFSERLVDVVAVTALAAGAVGLLANSGPALAVAVVALASGILALSSERVHRLALSLALKQRWMRQHREAAAAVSSTVRMTLGLRPLAVSALFSAAAWSCEGLAFALCLRELGFDGLTLPAAVAVYAISTLAGAFTFLPGGIGLTEASLAGLLVASGMHAADASAATLLIRLVTLWFGVALGWVVLASRPAVLRRLVRDPEADDA